VLLLPNHTMSVTVKCFMFLAFLTLLQELASEPALRKTVREVFGRNAEVTTVPTRAGRDHPLLEPTAK
jgi:hypothetical protein